MLQETESLIQPPGFSGTAYSSQITDQLVDYNGSSTNGKLLFSETGNGFVTNLFDFVLSPRGDFLVVRDGNGITIPEYLRVISLQSDIQKDFSWDALASQNIIDMMKKLGEEYAWVNIGSTDLSVNSSNLGDIKWSPDSSFIQGTIYLLSTGSPGVGEPAAPPIATSSFKLYVNTWTVEKS